MQGQVAGGALAGSATVTLPPLVVGEQNEHASGGPHPLSWSSMTQQ
eukprot:COSAG06_NODE_655_length_13338_cov_12.493013_12_plen_46_part_00